MLRIVSAPFHPDLETALLAEVRSLKQDDPLRPFAIIVPSRQLGNRLKRLLAVEHRLALMDVHVLTFYQLAMILLREQNPTGLPVLVNDAFREELLRSLAGRGIPGVEVFRGWSGMRGIWSGIWDAIQDLKEARVDPAAVLSALDEGLFENAEARFFKPLLHLYGAVLETDRALQAADPEDLPLRALECVPRSSFLKRMNRISYYGFYDLTQAQLDFFQAVASACSTTVFFPLGAGNPVYRFAQTFFDRHIRGLTGDAQEDAEPGSSATVSLGSLAGEMLPEVRGTCRIFSAVGLEAEVTAAAKEILRLIEEAQLDPMDIGVVARNLDPILPVLRRVFEANRIPFACPIGQPLIHEPLVKMVVRFIELRTRAFPRSSVMEVLTSPFCRPPIFDQAEAAPRPDQWDGITRRLGIAGGDADGGLGDWRRLEQLAERDDNAPELPPQLQPGLPIAQVHLLWDVIQKLHVDLSIVPDRAGWGEYAKIFSGLLQKWFGQAELTGHTVQALKIQEAVLDCLRALGLLDMLDEPITLEQWSEHAIRALASTRLPSDVSGLRGVQVLDAMDARGTPFRALFILGLNEKVFPRSIREDAFLSDAVREILERDLGYKIARKLEGFDEERLLFGLLLRSARERVYLSYQRTDAQGHAMAPSGYLAELQHDLWGTDPLRPGEPTRRESSIRRRPLEQWANWPFYSALLTPQEQSLQIILEEEAYPADRRHPLLSECLERMHPSKFLLWKEGMTAVAAIEAIQGGLHQYDGLLGNDSMHRRVLEREGTSPTALERYARCPFQYYGSQVLRLESLPRPEETCELDPRACGDLCHKMLRLFYERGKAAPVPLSPLQALEWVAEAAAEVFAEFERTHSTGYPLLWDLAREQITELVQQLVLSDLEEFRESGYTPSFFEIPLSAEIPLRPGEGSLRIHGVLDRVDVRKRAGKVEARVIDYKYTRRSAIRSEDKNLPLAASRGLRLQLPLYLLAAKSVPLCDVIAESAAFYFLAPKWGNMPVRAVLERSCWEGETGARITHTLESIFEGIRSGRFAVLPGDYCRQCDFAAVCRYGHDPTRRRARADAAMQTLKALRKVKAPTPGDLEIAEDTDDDMIKTPHV
jgi:ATP-dependent helicase/nuclease subunit B